MDSLMLFLKQYLNAEVKVLDRHQLQKLGLSERGYKEEIRERKEQMEIKKKQISARIAEILVKFDVLSQQAEALGTE